MAGNKWNKFYLYSIYWVKFYWNYILKSKYYQSLISRIYGISEGKELEKTICVDYLYNGEKYKVYLPFERKHVNRMLNDVVEIQYEDRSEIIHQQPGVSFFITPKHLGGKSATIFSLKEEKIIEENERIC